MWTCALCNGEDDGVERVATCGNKCDVYAHSECFAKRNTFTTHRKKHHGRSNSESELCLTKGCMAKCQLLRKSKIGTGISKQKSGGQTFAGSCELCLDDPENPCSFMGKDGLPCRRPARANGACRFHTRDAALMQKMIQNITEEDPEPTASTGLAEENARLIRQLEELNASVHRESRRSTKIQFEADETVRTTYAQVETLRHDLEVTRRQHDAASESVARITYDMDQMALKMKDLEKDNARLRDDLGKVLRREDHIRTKYGVLLRRNDNKAALITKITTLLKDL